MKASVNTVSIPTKELFEFPGNPNEQNTITYANLVEEIASDGFEEPLIVVPRGNFRLGVGGYYVVSGNHRLRAVKQLGYSEVDCVVHKDWDPAKAKIKVVKRNQMRGRTNAEKFTALVDTLEGWTHDQLSDAMGFRDIDAFAMMYNPEEKLKAFEEREGKYENLLDGMKDVINRIFADYGHTVPFGFLYFLWGTKVHLVIMPNKKVKKQLNRLMHACNSRGLDVNRILGAVLEKGMADIDYSEYDQPGFEDHFVVAEESDD